MPDWSKTEKTTTVVQYTVKADDKWGACWNEMELALSKAVKDWQDLHNGDLPSDDSIRVFPRDDAIIIEFNKPVTELSTAKQAGVTDAMIEDRAYAYARENAPEYTQHSDEPALVTKGGVAALLRDAYRTGAIRMASTLGSRGASRYDNGGTDRRTYEEPCCGNSKPHDAHMHSPIGGLTINCCGVS